MDRRLFPSVKRLRFAAAIVLTLVLCDGSKAAEERVRFGVYETAMLSCQTGGEEGNCLLTGITEHMAQKEGWQIAWVAGSYEETLDRLLRGDVDLMVLPSGRNVPEGRLRFSTENIYSTWAQIYAPAGASIQSLLDLGDGAVGVVGRDPYNREIRSLSERLGAHCRFIEFKDYREVFKALEKGWIDAGVCDRVYGSVHGGAFSGVVKTQVIFAPREYRFAIDARRSPNLIHAVDYHLKQLKQDPESIYYRLLRETLAPASNHRLFPFLKWGLGVAVGFLAVAAAFLVLLRRQVRVGTEKLRESERRYRSVFENTGTATIIVEPDLTVSMANQRAAELAGLPKEQIEGRMTAGRFIHPDDRQRVLQYHADRKEGKEAPAEYEIRMIDADGRTRDAMVCVGLIPGTERIVVSLVDLTEQKQLEGQLQQAQKMQAIGTLAGGIAHDFNNILGAIMGYAEMASITARGGDPELVRKLDGILEASERARDLVNQILTFSRQNKPDRKPIEIGPVIEEALKLIRASIPATVDLQTAIEAGSSIIFADAVQVHQIVMNLCSNAAHAMEDAGGELTVGLAAVFLAPDEARRRLGLAPGAYVLLTVSDTGCGMAPEVRERIFDPFFTTKDKGKGTGMGLSVIDGIVRNLGGTIRVYSEPGAGSTFQVYIPQVDAADNGPMPKAFAAEGGTERVLFVDDEPFLVDVATEMLSSLGYRVTARTSSLEAFQVFRRRPAAFDLAVIDQTMPQMTGLELAKKMTSIRPDMPVILCTGFSEALTADRVKDAGVGDLIFKPFVRQEMAAKIRQMLKTP